MSFYSFIGDVYEVRGISSEFVLTIINKDFSIHINRYDHDRTKIELLS